LAVTLAGRLFFFGLAGFFQQPVHHWHLSNMQSICHSSDHLNSTLYADLSQGNLLIPEVYRRKYFQKA
jgi:hypothetical protein